MQVKTNSNSNSRAWLNYPINQGAHGQHKADVQLIGCAIYMNWPTRNMVRRSGLKDHQKTKHTIQQQAASENVPAEAQETNTHKYAQITPIKEKEKEERARNQEISLLLMGSLIAKLLCETAACLRT